MEKIKFFFKQKMPRKNKNYATLKDFVDNASKTQQIEFWKKVAKIMMKPRMERGLS